MWLLLVASPALRLAPLTMQLRQAGSVSVATAGLAAGRAVSTMAVEQVSAQASSALVTERPKSEATGVVTALSGNAMEDMWEESRGRPLRRSLALWLFSMKATWRIIRAHKSEVKQTVVAGWVRDELLRLGPTMIKLGQVASARTDLLSQPYIDALVALQDSVPTHADMYSHVPGPSYCTYGLRVPAPRVLYAPRAQDSLPLRAIAVRTPYA